MRIKHHFQVWSAILILSVLALCMLLYTPVWAASSGPRANTNAASTTSINANAYLTGQMLQPLFQSDINQQLPAAVASVISSMIDQLPQADQGWGTQMANALLQPSATLLSLNPESSGLLITFKVDLYSGDPKPTTTSLLIGFQVINSTTIQVSALGNNGLVSGPLLTFQMPIGSPNSVSSTPNCGDADLKINLKYPVTLGSSLATSSQRSSATMPLSYRRANASASTPGSYVEIPDSSLAQIGSAIGSIPVTSSLTAQNIQVYTQGSNLAIQAQIHWLGIDIGTAVSLMKPGAAGGNLVVTVQQTNLEYFNGLITFPVNQYNQKIQQIVDAKFNGALTDFTVTQAAIGANSHIPCVSSTSLVLGGTTNLD